MRMISDFLHLTWSGRREMVWYRIRGVFVAPASEWDRCAMGGPIGPHVHCPRRCEPGELWCARHGGAA